MSKSLGWISLNCIFCKNQWEIKQESSYSSRMKLSKKNLFPVTCNKHERSFDPPTSVIDTFYSVSLLVFTNGWNNIFAILTYYFFPMFARLFYMRSNKIEIPFTIIFFWEKDTVFKDFIMNKSVNQPPGIAPTSSNIIMRRINTAPSQCRICEAFAQYSFYGALACCSCKVFFKRNAEHGQVN